jgi:fibronectin type 3 domain-containing protein
VVGADGYRIWQDIPSKRGFLKTVVADTTATTYDVLKLGVNTTYTFYINAYSKSGGSTYSAAVSVTTLTTVPIPAVPTGLAASPGTTQISLNWNAVPGATSYTVARWTLALKGVPPEFPIATVTGTNYVDSGLASGFPQTYYVKANNVSGSSAYSPSVTATTLTVLVWVPPIKPAPPAAPASVAGTVANPGSIDITWTAVAGATSYNVYNALGSNAVSVGPKFKLTNTSGTTVQSIGLVAGNTYSYIVTAVNANGESAASATVNVTIPVGSLPAPTLKVTALSYADPYGLPYYQDTVEIVTPTGTHNFNIYVRANPVTDPYPVYVLDTSIKTIPFFGAIYSVSGQYVLPIGALDANGVWYAVVLPAYTTQQHFVMTTVDATGKESAFSKEWGYHW